MNHSQELHKTAKGKKVALGLSGGVDSAVSAYLLQSTGYDVTGVYIQCWDKKGDGCMSDEDRAYALQTAAKLGIRFIHLDFTSQYKDKVMAYFYSEYRIGRTPNPDIVCNKEIKFGLFYDWVFSQGYDYVATGHYARVSEEGDDFKLLKGIDSSKDQSYFLYLLDQKRLSGVLFPIGGITKKEVRKIAVRENLPPATRPDSVGICFIGEVDVKEFLKARLPVTKGFVVNLKGEVVGSHDGAWFYTIGQRHGFSVDKYTGKPMYVLSKNSDRNELVVGTQRDALVAEFYVYDCHWIGKDPFEKSTHIICDIRIRHLGNLHSGNIYREGAGAKIRLDIGAFGVAPGQSAVFYRGDEVLGGGIIR